MRATVRRTRADGDRWHVGVDLGGTWVRVLAEDSAGRRRAVRARSPGLAGLPALLRALWARWGLLPRAVGGLVVATRGVWTRPERQREQRRLRPLGVRVAVIADAEAAHHAAFGSGAGVLVLAGTGSMVLGRDARGRWARAGGLGPLLGDEGSAFWLGREWLHTSPRAADFLAARRLLRSPDPVARIAALATGVLRRARAGDARARAIAARGERALADLLVATARRLRARPPVAVTWGGRLLDAADYRAGVWRAARRRGLRIEPSPPGESAVSAALRLATGLSRTREDTARPRAAPDSGRRRRHNARPRR